MFWGLLGSTASARMCWCCNAPDCHAPEEKMPTPGAHAASRNRNDMRGGKRSLRLITGGFRIVFILRQQVDLFSNAAFARQAVYECSHGDIFECDTQSFVKGSLIHGLSPGGASNNYIRHLAHSVPIEMVLLAGINQ